MPELIRSIANHLREVFGNRRRAPRFRARLDAELSLSISQRSVKATGRPLKLTGYTRDLSATGLALVMPATHIGGQYVTDQNRKLEIKLTLPTGLIEIAASPVRYDPLEDDTENGYLIGVQIISMSESDRGRFDAFLKTVGKR